MSRPGRASIGAALMALLLTFGCSGAEAPDLILHNGVVITMDESRPEAEAFLIRDGRFAAVGADEDFLPQIEGAARVIDLGGKTVIPGFNDAHLHPLLLPPTSISLAKADSIDALILLLREGAGATPDAPWIIGHDYDDTTLGRHLGRSDLDRVSTERPVMAWHGSLHILAVNSVALEAAGIGAETPDPDEGFFFRDEEGRPTGLISERSALEALVTDEQPTPLVNDLASALAGLEVFYQKALSLGITSITDGLVPPELAAAYWLSSPERAGVRVNLMLDAEDLQTAKWLMRVHDLVALTGWRPLDNPWLRARTIKLYHGLSLSGRTARLYEAYANRPEYFGLEPQRSQAELDELVEEIHDAGFQAAIHSNGDFEIDMVLEAIEKAVGDSGIDHRHRIEHGSIVNEKILLRMRDLGIVLAPHSYVYEKGNMLEAYGEQRWDWMFANASTFEYGIPNAANSDFPVSGLNPLLRIQSLVTRRSRNGKVYGPNQRLSVEQALYAYTMGGAYASFEEDEKGSIETGKLADFVVLSRDPRAEPVGSISSIQVEQSFVGGVKRYERLQSP
ncbi:MAG: amidohydrolase [Deltaproteobacteria bacterium]|nr:amidohydrolase [Deltaproteobacteria bacterium]MBW2396168.1 amidohydrolase [Deltaproteobacteria bacterium]